MLNLYHTFKQIISVLSVKKMQNLITPQNMPALINMFTLKNIFTAQKVSILISTINKTKIQKTINMKTLRKQQFKYLKIKLMV